MKIYKKIEWEWVDNQLVQTYEDSFTYEGELLLAEQVVEEIAEESPFSDLPGAIVGAIVTAGGNALNEGLNEAENQVDTGFGAIEDIGNNLADNIIEATTSVDVDLDADLELKTGSSESFIVFNPFKPQVTSLPLIYGTRETEGKLIFQETNADPGEYLYRYYALSEGTITSITPTTDPTTLIDTTSQGTGTSNWFYKFWLGGDSGIDYSAYNASASSDFRYGFFNTADDPKPVSWTSNHKCKGIAVAFHRFKYGTVSLGGTDYVLNKVPKITHLVDGISLSGNNDNPANILKDYLTNTRYGAGIDSSKIDTTSFNSVRDYCDELDSGNKRFTCNIILNTQNAVLDNVKLILQTFFGQLHFRNGKYYLHTDQAFSGTAVVNYSTSNIIGGIAVTVPSKETRINQCIVTYFDKNNSYQPAEAIWPDPNVTAENTTRNTYLSQDGNEELIKRVSIPGITNFNQARYIAQIAVKKSRQSTIVTMNTTAESANVVPGDIVTLTWDSLSYSNKEFRVREIKISPYGGMNLTLQEHQDSFYARDTVTDTSAISAINTGTPTIDAVTGLSAVEQIYSTRDGAGVKTKVVLSWNAVNSTFLDRYLVDYKLSSATSYTPAFETDLTSVDLFDFGIGAFDFRVRAKRLDGVLSTASTTSLTTTGLATPPSKVEGLFVNSMGTMALLQWTLSSDLDVVQGGYYSIKHSVDSGASSWSQGVRISDNVAGHQNSAIVPLLSGTYMIRAHDSSGQVSLPTFVQSAGSSLQALQTEASVTEEPDFTGTKVRTVAVDDLLKIESESELDSISNFDNITLFDPLNGIWNTSSSGYSSEVPQYNFANYMDLSTVKTVRLRQYINSTATSVFDLIDERTANIDTWEDFDDTEFDKTSVRMQVRSTNDDPSGTPSWGDWSDFYVEERSARAHQFRIFPETVDSEYNITIRNLQVIAETLA